ncbi:hypothetical protein [Dongshaea marina]|uniref:hypothetical protein n=1 Tax=Dongshaea marina TaxID=2047966 RepID=UPI000D3EC962|nr:hypothetical protein [Dongshaea marina]
MSVINQMLRDLEKREQAGPSAAPVMTVAGSRSRWWIWLLLGLVILLLLGAAQYWWLSHSLKSTPDVKQQGAITVAESKVQTEHSARESKVTLPAVTGDEKIAVTSNPEPKKPTELAASGITAAVEVTAASKQVKEPGLAPSLREAAPSKSGPDSSLLPTKHAAVSPVQNVKAPLRQRSKISCRFVK